jgi:transposase
LLTLEERLAVVNLYEELGSYRAVAAVVGCDHKTVKAWLARGRTGRGTVTGVVRRRATDLFLHLIRERVEMTEGRVRGKRLLKVLRAAGYTASLRTLQRALRIEKRRWQERQRRVYRPWLSAPADFLIVDWGEVSRVATAAGPRKLYCFCAVLGWSRWRYVRFFTCQRFQVLAQGLAACFEALGGVPAHVLFDNPKTVTTEFVAGLSVLNAEMVRLATHYRFTPVTAAASDPESKGKVEALVRYVKSNLVPEEGFASLDEANLEAERWCAEGNGQVHEETRTVPAEQLEQERPLLRQLVERPPLASGESRKVDQLSTIRLGSARYSVPARLRGAVVQVLVDGDEVRVLHDGSEVALHQLQPPGGASIQDEHYPTPAPTGVRPLRPRHAAEVRFLELGEPAERYLRAAAAAGTQRLRLQLERVLELVHSHGREPVRAALARAVEFGRFGHEDVAAILLAGGAAPPSRLEPAQPLALAGLPEVPQREMTSYRWSA